MWDECNCVVVWAFFGIAFLWDWNVILDDLSFMFRNETLKSMGRARWLVCSLESEWAGTQPFWLKDTQISVALGLFYRATEFPQREKLSDLLSVMCKFSSQCCELSYCPVSSLYYRLFIFSTHLIPPYLCLASLGLKPLRWPLHPVTVLPSVGHWEEEAEHWLWQWGGPRALLNSPTYFQSHCFQALLAPWLWTSGIFNPWNFLKFSGMNLLAPYWLSSMKPLRFSLVHLFSSLQIVIVIYCLYDLILLYVRVCVYF